MRSYSDSEEESLTGEESDGLEIPDTFTDEEESDRIEERQQDVLPEDEALSPWKRALGGLYLEHKSVFDNPRYYDQETGAIHWPGQGRDVNTDGFLNGQYEETNLPAGMIIDRYGGNNGTFFAEDGLSIEERAMAPNSDFSTYNRYEVKKSIPVRAGIIAPWFDQPGGGIQYQLDPEFVQNIRGQLHTGEALIDGLIRLGYLKRL